MKQIKPTATLLALILICSISAFSQNTQKEEVEKIRKSIEETHRDIDWEQYDTASIVSIDKIKPELIQGLWTAYNGLFKFNGAINSMILTKPVIIIEVKGDQYRRTMDSKFEKYTLRDNRLVPKKEEDSGVINKITANLLVITWKRGDSYTRYY